MSNGLHGVGKAIGSFGATIYSSLEYTSYDSSQWSSVETRAVPIDSEALNFDKHSQVDPTLLLSSGSMDDITVKYLRFTVKTNRALGYLPYGWRRDTQTVTFDSSPWKRTWFLAHSLLIWPYIIHIDIRAIYVSFINSDGTANSSRTNIQFVAVGTWVIAPFQFCSLFYYGRHHVVINRYLKLRKELQEEWNTSRPLRKCISSSNFSGNLCTWPFSRLFQTQAGFLGTRRI